MILTLFPINPNYMSFITLSCFNCLSCLLSTISQVNIRVIAEINCMEYSWRLHLLLGEGSKSTVSWGGTWSFRGGSRSLDYFLRIFSYLYTLFDLKERNGRILPFSSIIKIFVTQIKILILGNFSTSLKRHDLSFICHFFNIFTLSDNFILRRNWKLQLNRILLPIRSCTIITFLTFLMLL